MWTECTREALPTLSPQTPVLLRWCQNVRHPPLALLLPTLQMAAEAEEGRVVVAAHASAQAACTLELGLPGKAAGERQLFTTL